MNRLSTFRVCPFLLGITAAICFSCSEDADLPAEPKIELIEVDFGRAPNSSRQDSITLTFTYNDGDGDLGMPKMSPNRPYFEYPFHEYDYFLKNSGEKVSSDKLDRGEVSWTDLITFDDRASPPYDTLPQNENDCRYQTVEIEDDFGTGWKRVYSRKNENCYNLQVDVLVQNTAGVFESLEKVWSPHCISFDGRFVIPDNGNSGYPSRFIFENSTSRNGKVTYVMASFGWLYMIDDQKFKLRFYIQDQSFNRSNVIETPEYTLAELE